MLETQAKTSRRNKRPPVDQYIDPCIFQHEIWKVSESRGCFLCVTVVICIVLCVYYVHLKKRRLVLHPSPMLLNPLWCLDKFIVSHKTLTCRVMQRQIVTQPGLSGTYILAPLSPPPAFSSPQHLALDLKSIYRVRTIN